MTNHLALPTLLLGSVLALGACGSADRAPEPDVLSPVAAPTSDELTDYAYTLRVSCYCLTSGSPVRVTVRDGEVTSAVHLRTGPDHEAGDRASRFFRLSIADIVRKAERARAQGAHQVEVRWPEEQAYPRSVYIDRDELIADEELGYSIRRVTPTPEPR